METNYLFLSLAFASLGFLLWYNLSASLRLPKSFQIQFDVNGSYFSRILMRRLLGFVLYFLVPYILIFDFAVLGPISYFSELNISFTWNRSVTLWVIILGLLSIIVNLLVAGKGQNLEEYPEIRVTIWTPHLILASALAWILYLAGLEFLFRGLVLQSLYMIAGDKWMAILVSAGIYAMVHYFKNNRISTFSMPFGVVLAFATLQTGSLIPAILVHIIGGLVTEWLAIYLHPEIKFRFRLY